VIVLDASAAVRLLLEGSPQVAEAVRAEPVIAPCLLPIEVANALATSARTRRLDPDAGRRALGLLLELPIELVATETLARPALEAAFELGISAYDAAYLVLAVGREATLLTADRRLAGLAGRSQLVA
jgi:predicted nucleic acid-binding protein